MRPTYFLPIDYIIDCYWCNIPVACRKCDDLKECRKGFFQLRKCHNGCLKIKRRLEYRKESDREDYINSLIEYTEKLYRKENKKL